MQKRVLRDFNMAEWLAAMGLAALLIAGGIANVYGNHAAAGWTLIAVGIMAFIAACVAEAVICS